MFKIIWRNTCRHPLRTGLTVLGLAVAVMAFCLLRTVVAAWYSGVELSSPLRLVTRNAVSLLSPLPLSHLAKIQAIPGVRNVGYAYWFEGIYRDRKNFFPQFALSVPGYLEMYPEFVFPPEQKLAFIKDRRACAAGRKLARRFGWKIGDTIVLQGTYFEGEYQLVLRAIYKGRDPATDETQFFFHWDYLNERLKKTAPQLADQVGWFLVQVERPELAPLIARQIDAAFKNSLAETLTETEAAFNLSFIEMTGAILLAIQVVSWVVIGVIWVVLANTMAMNARERLGEFAVLRTLGFRPSHLAALLVGESLLLSFVGGLLGLLLSYPLLGFFPKEVEQYFPGLYLTRETLGLGLASALGVGLSAALLPAFRAGRGSIADVLRRVG